MGLCMNHCVLPSILPFVRLDSLLATNWHRDNIAYVPGTMLLTQMNQIKVMLGMAPFLPNKETGWQVKYLVKLVIFGIWFLSFHLQPLVCFHLFWLHVVGWWPEAPGVYPFRL